MKIKRVAMLLVLILVFGFILAGQAKEVEPPGRYSLHLVQSGDTLWSISSRYMPGIDPRQGVEWIRKANGLDGSIIQPGDILNVPDASGPLLEPLGPRYSSEAAAKAADEEGNRILGFTEKEIITEPEPEPYRP